MNIGIKSKCFAEMTIAESAWLFLRHGVLLPLAMWALVRHAQRVASAPSAEIFTVEILAVATFALLISLRALVGAAALNRLIDLVRRKLVACIDRVRG
jgi:hypothetical protein